MGRKVHNWCCGLIFILILNQSFCDEISLQSALNAMSRRQQDMAGYPKYGKFYSESGASRFAPDNDLVFLGSPDSHSLNNKDKSPIEYLEDMDYANKHISSPFRERTEENRLHEKQKLAEMILNDARNSDEYAEILRELYQKYGQYEPHIMEYYNEMYGNNNLRKRSRQFPSMGLNMVGMKKRSRNYSPPDESRESLYLMNVPSRNQVYPNSMAKRFPVTKRSSTYYPIPFTNEMPRQYKRSSPSRSEKNMQTDPKVAQDLSSIFNHNTKRKAEEHSEMDKTVAKPKRTEHATETTDTNLKITTTKKPDSKESVTDVKNAENEKPIQLKKKSIDWSDYFGIDKRKKNDNIDNEWLMERYHKAIALTSKRNPASEESTDKFNKTKSLKELSTSDDKINEMDTKLKNIEYAIVDDALKMSGTQHEDDIDSKEVQEMKDKIISQLAAAYNLEKMRRALNEYRETIKKERLGVQNKESHKLEEKRLSVPRKSAVDTEAASADNNIKCTNGDENCVEQNYKTPEDLLDANNYGYCPKIQQACSEIASVLGQYEKMLETACIMHQMCLLCGDNTWFPPTRQCNVLFLNKADYICNEDVECREVARHSTRYLLELNKLLKAEPLDSCDLTC